jgi:drug/metabolite transporter (DMT)-like permease
MAILASEGPTTTSAYLRGALCGLSAVCIWAAFIVVSRLGVSTSLTPWDVAAIRFAVAGVILLPYLLKRGLALERLGWQGVAAVAVGCGAPMVLLVNAGLLFAPAAQGGALFPGVMPEKVLQTLTAFQPTPELALARAVWVTGRAQVSHDDKPAPL